LICQALKGTQRESDARSHGRLRPGLISPGVSAAVVAVFVDALTAVVCEVVTAPDPRESRNEHRCSPSSFSLSSVTPARLGESASVERAVQDDERGEPWRRLNGWRETRTLNDGLDVWRYG